MSCGARFGKDSPGQRLGRLTVWLAAAAVGLLAATFLLSPPASAQTEPLQITAVSVEGWPTIEATLTVFGPDGQPLTGLVQEDFSATLDGESLPATTLRTTSDPGLGIAVLLAFDVSGSMAGEPLEQARLAGHSLIDKLGADDQAAIVAFASNVQVVQSFTADRASLLAAIDGLAAGGDTALYGGVQQSAELVSSAPYARKSIVLLSDGYDFGGVSTTTRQGSLDIVHNSGALVFAVGLGPETDQGYLSELAQAGKGQFLLAPLPDDLTQAYLSAGNVLRQQYVLTLDATGLDAESDPATLVVQANLAGTPVAASASIDIPAGAVQPEPPAATAPPPAADPVGVSQTGEDTEASSGGAPWTLILGLAAAFAAGAAGLFVVVRRRRPAGNVPVVEPLQHSPAEVAFPEISRAVDETDAQAWLQDPGGARVSIGQAPVTVGHTPDCTLVLSNGAGQERVRIWLRDGRYMLHNLSRLGSVSVAGRPATWVVLEDGDEIAIGDAQLVFRCGNGAG